MIPIDPTTLARFASQLLDERKRESGADRQPDETSDSALRGGQCAAGPTPESTGRR